MGLRKVSAAPRRRLCVRLAALAALTLAVGSPARASQSELGDEPVDAGYRMQVFDGETKRDPFRLYVMVRLTPLDGKLKVCGVYVADMSDKMFAQLQAELHDINSRLRIGAADARGQIVRPGFLASKRAVVIEGMDGKPRLPLQGLRANCIETDAAWEDRFATEPFALQLQKTRFKRYFLFQ
jgi:hypothetical protein